MVLKGLHFLSPGGGVLLRQLSNKVNLLLTGLTENGHFSFRMFGRYVACKKWFNIYFVTMGFKESVCRLRICY